MKQKGITAESRVTFDTAPDEIINYADAIEAGLVAMSTYGRSRGNCWALGSVAEGVLRAGNTPLLLVRTPGASIQ